jgi:hypothetical protein
MFPAARLKQYREQMAALPGCDTVCAEMVAMHGSGNLLGTTADMDDIINAVMKVYDQREQLKNI